MLLNVAIAAFMMIVTTCIHAGGMELMLRGVKNHRAGLRAWLRKTRIYWVVTTILVMFAVALLEALAWASVYLALGALKGLEQALYFSLVTFTTLGYGEIVLDERWRLLASFEAANGIIMFGWSTAIVMAVVHRVYLAGNAESR
ncbi:MAG: potassium channel family protein [Desulfuromonadales bacterium]|nr:potassium channel family protein [Desulfuromonadales bacterium]